jgi:hypothetical protein
MSRVRRFAAVPPLASLWLTALAHHPGDPTEALHWWELVIAGGIALAAFWIVTRIRRRGARRRGAPGGAHGTPPDDVT